MLAENTVIPLFTGHLKFAKNLRIGDLLIGDNGKPRWVMDVVSHVNPDVYNIMHSENEYFTVSGDYVLVLKYLDHKKIYCKNNYWHLDWWEGKGPQSILMKNESDLKKFAEKIIDEAEIVYINIKDYIEMPSDLQKKLVGIRNKCVDWAYENIDISPYIMGMWLGDSLSTNDACILNTYSVIKKHLDYYNLYNTKYIPKNYILNGKDIRLGVLAGFIDTYNDVSVEKEGELLVITLFNKYYGMLYDLLLLTRSLGFKCYIKLNENTTYNMFISGALGEIPTTNHLLKNVDVLSTGYIKVEKKTYSNLFVKISVDENRRFLVNDFSVSM